MSSSWEGGRSPSPVKRVLLLETDPGVVDRVTAVLEGEYPDSRLLRVDGRNEFTSALRKFSPDVILSAPVAGELEAPEALSLAQAALPECSFLLLGEEFSPAAMECIRSGAADFVSNSNLARLGIAIKQAVRERAGLRSLSSRQRQVLRLLANGYSNRQIAERLSRSIKTVETHRALLMVRLGIDHLPGLVRYAVGLGMVSAASPYPG